MECGTFHTELLGKNQSFDAFPQAFLSLKQLVFNFPCSKKGFTLFSFLTIAMDLLRRIKRENQGSPARREHNSRKAICHWRVIVGKLQELIVLVAAQEQVSSWQEDGSSIRLFSSLSSGAATLAPQSPSTASYEPKNAKGQIYKELIKTGDPLPLTKSKTPPAVSFAICAHPADSLVGAGNQSQREIWCRKCHQRWLVDHEVMDQLKSKGEAKKKAPNQPLEHTLPIVKKLLANMPRVAPVAKMTEEESEVSSIAPLSEAQPSTAAAERSTRVMGYVVNYQCGKEADRLIVKKDGPTKGRHFYKCRARLCNFFEWDATEVQELQQAQRQAQAIATRSEEMIQEAERRHMTAMEEQRIQFNEQVQYLQGQIMWLTALAGEERISQVMASAEAQQEVTNQAMNLRDSLHGWEEIQETQE